MSRRTFEQLIDAYADAQFDLGEHNCADDATRNAVQARATQAREDLVKALRKAGLPLAAVVVV